MNEFKTNPAHLIKKVTNRLILSTSGSCTHFFLFYPLFHSYCSDNAFEMNLYVNVYICARIIERKPREKSFSSKKKTMKM